MTQARVLLVDDTAVIRSFMAAFLKEAGYSVQTAFDGQDCLDRMDREPSDLIVLDVEMPVLDGLATCKIVTQRHKHVPVIMFSTLTARGADTTLEGLYAGASDYLIKPSGLGNRDEVREYLRGNLVPKIEQLLAEARRRKEAVAAQPPPASAEPEAGRPEPNAPTPEAVSAKPEASPPEVKAPPVEKTPAEVQAPPAERPQAPRRSAPPPAPKASAPKERVRTPLEARANTGLPPLSADGGLRLAEPALRNHGVRLVAIGVSTGGPRALEVVLTALPAGFSVPIAIVQHMPAYFTKSLADSLNAKCRIRVHEAAAGMVLEAGHIYIAPGEHHLKIVSQGGAFVVKLDEGLPVNFCKPSVDVMFNSLAEAELGSGVLAVVLTGMGSDGLEGAKRLKARGASVLAQDQASSVVWGMPGYVARAGIADAVLPLGDVAAELVKRTPPLRPAQAA